jgi:hypothetical protein
MFCRGNESTLVVAEHSFGVAGRRQSLPRDYGMSQPARTMALGSLRPAPSRQPPRRSICAWSAPLRMRTGSNVGFEGSPRVRECFEDGGRTDG